MIKYFCDGCDNEVKYEDIIKVDLYIVWKIGRKENVCHSFELCKPCSFRLSDNLNPKKWHRDVPAGLRDVPAGLRGVPIGLRDVPMNFDQQRELDNLKIT